MPKNQFLIKLFSGIHAYLLNASERFELNRIKKLPNVYIDDSFKPLSIGCININGAVKTFSIENQVTCRLNCNFYLHEGADLSIHKNVFFNNGCSVNCLGVTEIGENTIFGEGVKIYDHNHKFGYNNNGELRVERGEFSIGKVIIGKNYWIGSNVTIINNVTIGDNVIIGANCLIYESFLTTVLLN